MRDTTAGRLTATLIIVGAAGFLVLWSRPFTPRPNTALHKVFGETLAEQAVKLLKPSGRLTLITRETSEFEAPATELQLRGFRRALEKAGRKVDATKLIKIDPNRVVAVPTGDFFELLRKGSDEDVIVSFMGPPNLTDAQIGRLGDRRPRVVAQCTIVPAEGLSRLFTNDLLHVAIISKKDAVRTATPPAGAQGWFDFYYEVITSNSPPAMPIPAGAGQ